MEKRRLNNELRIAEQDFLYIPDFLQKPEQVLKKIENAVDLQYHNIKIFGKEIKEPRSTSFLSTKEMTYKYSGVQRNGLPYPPVILQIREKIEKEVHCKFNSCLINSYKDGQEYMGWHNDNEPELGKKPNIACVSLGSERDFQFKSSNLQYDIALKSGSLFLMRDSFQEIYKHQLPKRLKLKDRRISLSFRLLKT